MFTLPLPCHPNGNSPYSMFLFLNSADPGSYESESPKNPAPWSSISMTRVDGEEGLLIRSVVATDLRRFSKTCECSDPCLANSLDLRQAVTDTYDPLFDSALSIWSNNQYYWNPISPSWLEISPMQSESSPLNLEIAECDHPARSVPGMTPNHPSSSKATVICTANRRTICTDRRQ